MIRRALIAALALAFAAPAFPAGALAHEGNPDYRSDIDPTPDGVTARMLNFDDTLELEVEPGHELVVLGYEGEPYIRFLADGTVEVNRRSPSHYLNEDRFAEVAVPDAADPDARPQWEPAGAHGRYAWHDHRVHYMSRSLPPVVTDESVETKVFDWKLPIELDGERDKLTGTLYWVGEAGGVSIVLALGLGAGVLASLGLAVWRIRRRNARPDRPAAEAPEAW